jgi:putative endopeptidase
MKIGTLTVAMLAICASLAAQTDLSKPPGKFDAASVDRSIRPCVDFQQYACHAWQQANPIPSDQAGWGPGSQLAKWNLAVLRDILEKSAAGSSQRTPTEQKIGDYYASCLDEAAIDKGGLRSIKPELDRIAALRTRKQIAGELANLHLLTFGFAGQGDSGFRLPIFGLTSSQDLDDASQVVAMIDQGGLGLPDRDYYFRSDDKSRQIRAKYIDHIQNVFKMTGDSAATASAKAKDVMAIETELARGSMDIVKRRDPANLNHKLSLEQLKALMPSFDWDAYLGVLHVPATHHYLVLTPDFLRAADKQLATRPLSAWKSYLQFQLVNTSGSLLPTNFADERFDFYGKMLVGQKQQRTRAERCSSYVDRDLGELVGRAYVEREFPPESKERMLKLVAALESALDDDIASLDWMTADTKKQAHTKLLGIMDKIGYPDHWRDYSALSVTRGDALGNAYRAGAFELRRQLGKIGKPVDRGEWLITPATVDAYYDPQTNTVNFPAGILQPPFFDMSLDDAVNFGSIGAIIGHELTHGFDDQGRKFDATGNLRDWWTAADAKQFDERAKCISNEYSGFIATGDVHVNGDLTLGENTADNGGVRIALRALHKTLAAAGKENETIDGLTPDQRFFLAFAKVWCAQLTPEATRVMAQTNPHSPPQYRVNGVLSNLREFQNAFSCQAGDPMVSANACVVW